MDSWLLPLQKMQERCLERRIHLCRSTGFALSVVSCIYLKIRQLVFYLTIREFQFYIFTFTNFIYSRSHFHLIFFIFNFFIFGFNKSYYITICTTVFMPNLNKLIKSHHMVIPTYSKNRKIICNVHFHRL